MASIIVETQPAVEPVSLAEVKLQLGIGPLQDSDHVTSAMEVSRLRGLITAAREYCETFTGLSFINKGYVQYLDSFPYFTDTIQSQLAYPPSYYSLPRYSTTLWNYSQMIKLFYSPLVSVTNITYIGTDAQSHVLQPGTPDNQSGDFVIDTSSRPPRLFPNSGQFWPACLYVPNAVAIHFTAGYGADASTVPNSAKVAIKQLVAHWYKDPSAVGNRNMGDTPKSVAMLLGSLCVIDFSPARG